MDISIDIIKEYHIIFIDEGHFFSDLHKFVLIVVDKYKKNTYS